MREHEEHITDSAIERHLRMVEEEEQTVKTQHNGNKDQHQGKHNEKGTLGRTQSLDGKIPF